MRDRALFPCFFVLVTSRVPLFSPASVFSEIELTPVDQAMGLLPHALAFMPPFFFGLCTWRLEAHVQSHPGKALPLTASQMVVIAIASSLLSIISGGEGRKFSETTLFREDVLPPVLRTSRVASSQCTGTSFCFSYLLRSLLYTMTSPIYHNSGWCVIPL